MVREKAFSLRLVMRGETARMERAPVSVSVHALILVGAMWSVYSVMAW